MKSRYLWLLTLKIGAAGALFLSQVLPARFMETGNYGNFAYIFALTTVFSFFVSWGTDKFALKKASLSTLETSHREFGQELFGIWSIILINSVVAGFALFVYLKYFFGDGFLDMIGLLSILLLVSISLSRLSSSITKGLGRVITSEIIFSFTRPTIFIGLVVADYFYFAELTINRMLVYMLTAFLISNLLTGMVNYGKTGFCVSMHLPSIPKVYKYSFFFFIVSIGMPLLSNVDLIQLGAMRTSVDVAVYSVASKIVNLVLLGLVSANLLIAPKLPKLYAENKLDKIHSTIRENNIVVAILTVIPITFLIVFTSEILNLFGSDYIAGTDILTILLVGQMVNVFCGPVLLTAVLTGQQKNAALIVLFVCALEWLLCVLLIPYYGSEGAAFANVTAYIVMNVALAFIVFKRIGINVTMLNIFMKRTRHA